MAVPCVRLALLLCLLIPATAASPRSRSPRKSPARASASRPTAFFEVDRPPRPRGGSGRCSTLLLSASFASTFDKPPATAAYSPPRCLVKAGGRASAISLAVLEWRAACQGAQLDRIFGVWLAGAELLRGSTAAPPPNGIVWSVSKDVTKYASLLAAAGNSTFAVYLGNLVNTTLTGVYHANVTLHLYLRRTPTTKPPPATAPADLIVPMARALPPNGGLWFPIQSAADVASKSVAMPSNTYRAVLELYVSFHEDDELWYKNETRVPERPVPRGHRSRRRCPRRLRLPVPRHLPRRHLPPPMEADRPHRLLQPPDVRHRPDSFSRQAAGRQGARVRVRRDQRRGRVVRQRQPPPLAGPRGHRDDGGPRELRRAAGEHDVVQVCRPRRHPLPRDGEPARLLHRVGEVIVREHNDQRHAHVRPRVPPHLRDTGPDHRCGHRRRRHGRRRRRPVLDADARELPAWLGLSTE
ncbi:hypothetical protein VPH35_071639 [Triticum aestivum]